MPLTPEQIAKILQKEASLPVALKRDNHTNYREGYFFITLRIHDNAPILSTIIGNFDALDDSSDAPCCKYTELGKKVLEKCFYLSSLCEFIGCRSYARSFARIALVKTWK